MSHLLTAYTLFTLILILVSSNSIADEQSQQLIEQGFALREQALLIESQANNMIQSSRQLDKTAIRLRLNAKHSNNTNKPMDTSSLNQASQHLNTYGATFRDAHKDIMSCANTLLREGFLRHWHAQLIHTEPMQIEGSFVSGKTSDFLKMSFSAQNKPNELDLSIAKLSSNGLYYVIVQSQNHPLILNQFHTWKLIIADKDANPVSNLNIDITGDMPSHGHGMASTPKISSAQNPGIYLLEGMKFQMRGWWIITFKLDGKQGIDTVSFNLDL